VHAAGVGRLDVVATGDQVGLVVLVELGPAELVSIAVDEPRK
jgi:hypothetical protein